MTLFSRIITQKMINARNMTVTLSAHQRAQIVTHGHDYVHSMNYSMLEFAKRVYLLKATIFESVIKMSNYK